LKVPAQEQKLNDMNAPNKKDRLIVYTVLMGQNAKLNPVPHFPNVDFVCFTDQNLDHLNGWTERIVSPELAGDSPRSSRHPKVNPHLYLKDYERSIYVDTNVQLLKDPELLWNQLAPKPEIVFGAIYHSFHFSMFDLIKSVSNKRFDDNDLLLEQLLFCEREFPGYLSARPVWGAILARRHNNQDVKLSMEDWFSNIVKYSRRDQISLPLAIRKLRGDQVSLIHLNRRESDFHIWPSGGYQKPQSYFSSENIAVSWDAYHPAERDSLLTERDSLLKSKSWKLTEPLRALNKAIKPKAKPD
jgi:hypothetical protein